MISKKDILKMVHEVTHRTGGHAVQKQINPHREWLIGLVLFLAVSLTGGFFSVRSHAEFNSFETNVIGEMTPVKKYDDSAAASVKEMYIRKIETFNALASDVPIVSEPEPEIDTAEIESGEDEPLLEEGAVGDFEEGSPTFE